MSKAQKDLLAYLEGQQTQLDGIVKMMPTIPEEIARLSQQIKDVISAVSSSSAELHDIYIGVQALRLETDRKLTPCRISGNAPT